MQCSLLHDPVNQPPTTASTLNISSHLLFANSSTSVSDFSYIIPYNQPQDCDIYGSPCQVGSITVGVNLTTTTTNTVLPCSSYLSAQWTYLWNQTWFGIPTQENQPTANKGEGWSGERWSDDDDDPWGNSFGQSPQCRSYAEALDRGQSGFPDCAINNASTQTDGEIPLVDILKNYPGLVRYFDPDDFDAIGTCCGNCSLDIPEVRLYYFPDWSTTDCHSNQTFNSTSAPNLEKRIHSLVTNESTVIVSGHTL